MESFLDLSAGKQVETGSPTDLAIDGSGFFVVRGTGDAAYTRQGQFTRTSDGHLVTSGGLALQAADGGDIVLANGPFTVGADGIVTQQGAPVARVAVVDFSSRTGLAESGGLLTGAGSDSVDAPGATVRQGALEQSNVSTGEEMVSMMEALRRAEGAQRLVNVYDELLGRVLSTVGQN
jgi:flagellar basal body rod protein FlgG